MDQENYDFHKLTPIEFENLSATVIGHQFKIPQMLTFADGRDGGRDAAARGVNIDLGGGTLLSNQNVVVQAKHTQKAAGRLDCESILKRVFLTEVKKVARLVKQKHLDIYIIVTNYSFPAGQEEKLVKRFREAGAGKVLVVGKETLRRWIRESGHLRKEVPRLYNIGGPSTHDLAEKTVSEVTEVKKIVEEISARSNTTDRLEEIQGCISDIQKNIIGNQKVHVPAADATIPQSVLVKLSECPGLMENWKFVARRLKMKESKIKCIANGNKDLTEQVYQMLISWLEDCIGTKKETIDELSQALEKSCLKGIAEYLEDEIASEN